MPEPIVMLAGEEGAAQALIAALSEAGYEGHFQTSSGVREALTGIERQLEERHPAAAVSVGTSEEALALAITAAKEGVPLAAYGAGSEGAGDEARILATLAGAELGSDPARAADLIVAWLAERDQAET